VAPQPPSRKSDLVTRDYELDAPSGPTTVAVKITDVLGKKSWRSDVSNFIVSPLPIRERG
jgi:hypothetical protein